MPLLKESKKWSWSGLPLRLHHIMRRNLADVHQTEVKKISKVVHTSSTTAYKHLSVVRIVEAPISYAGVFAQQYVHYLTSNLAKLRK